MGSTEKDDFFKRDNYTDSDGEVGSLLDSVVDEDGDDDSLAAVSGDEGDECSQFVDPTGRQQESAYHPHGQRDSRRERGFQAYPPPAPTSAMLYSQPPPAPRSDGLAFDLNQPWQRSLLKQYEQQLSTPAGRQRKRPDLMYVIHTESRDHAISWDEGSAYSMDTTNNSAAPMQPQFVHRIHHPVMYEPEPPDGVSSLSETTAKEGRDDSTSHHHHASGNTSPPPFVKTQQHQQQSPRSVIPPPPRRKQRMHDQVQPYMVEPEAAHPNMAPPDPACYCLGYNMLDVLFLPPQRRRLSRRLSRVEEEQHNILYHHQQAGL